MMLSTEFLCFQRAINRRRKHSTCPVVVMRDDLRLWWVWVHFHLCISRMHGRKRILMKLITTITHMTLMTLSRSWVQRSRSQTFFKECTFRQTHTDLRFTVDDLVGSLFAVFDLAID